MVVAASLANKLPSDSIASSNESPISVAAFLTKSSQLSVLTLHIGFCQAGGCFNFLYSVVNTPGSLQNKHRQDCKCVFASRLERVLLDGALTGSSPILRFLLAADSKARLSFEGANSAWHPLCHWALFSFRLSATFVSPFRSLKATVILLGSDRPSLVKASMFL